MGEQIFNDIDLLHVIAERTNGLRFPLYVKGSDERVFDLLDAYSQLPKNEKSVSFLNQYVSLLMLSVICFLLLGKAIYAEHQYNSLLKRYTTVSRMYLDLISPNHGKSKVDSVEINAGLSQFVNIPQNLLDTLQGYVTASIDTTFTQLLTTQGYDLSKDTLFFKRRVPVARGFFEQKEAGIPTSFLLPIIEKKIRNITYGNVSEQNSANQYLEIFTEDYYASQDALFALNSIIFEQGKKYTYGEKIKLIASFVGNSSQERNGLGEKLSLKGLVFDSDYNVPGVLVPFVGGDCNSNVGLFVQLCRINNIPSAIGMTPGHVYAYVGVKESDLDILLNGIPDRLPGVKVVKNGGLAYIAVEPSGGGEWTRGKLNASGNNDGFAIFRPE